MTSEKEKFVDFNFLRRYWLIEREPEFINKKKKI